MAKITTEKNLSEVEFSRLVAKAIYERCRKFDAETISEISIKNGLELMERLENWNFYYTEKEFDHALEYLIQQKAIIQDKVASTSVKGGRCFIVNIPLIFCLSSKDFI
jgi:hypothetical protein